MAWQGARASYKRSSPAHPNHSGLFVSVPGLVRIVTDSLRRSSRAVSITLGIAGIALVFILFLAAFNGIAAFVSTRRRQEE